MVRSQKTVKEETTVVYGQTLNISVDPVLRVKILIWDSSAILYEDLGARLFATHSSPDWPNINSFIHSCHRYLLVLLCAGPFSCMLDIGQTGAWTIHSSLFHVVFILLWSVEDCLGPLAGGVPVEGQGEQEISSTARATQALVLSF